MNKKISYLICGLVFVLVSAIPLGAFTFLGLITRFPFGLPLGVITDNLIGGLLGHVLDLVLIFVDGVLWAWLYQKLVSSGELNKFVKNRAIYPTVVGLIALIVTILYMVARSPVFRDGDAAAAMVFFPIFSLPTAYFFYTVALFFENRRLGRLSVWRWATALACLAYTWLMFFNG